ncbi:MAG: hypothetical protein LBM77_01490 [Spirochaetaceae bacterium]|jgi:NhaP-type Na+/H+ and K+/H+ antiporter|nr:hypothetical protein [Spirochaetaceae bacterium]
MAKNKDAVSTSSKVPGIEKITAEYVKIGDMLKLFYGSLGKSDGKGRNAGNQGISEAQKIVELMKRNKKITVEGVTQAKLEKNITILHEMTSLDTMAEIFKSTRRNIKDAIGKELMKETKKVKDYVRYRANSGDKEFAEILKEIRAVERKQGKKSNKQVKNNETDVTK